MNSSTTARADARRLYNEGLDHAARLQYARAFASMRESLRREPTYVPALSYLMSDAGGSTHLGAILDTIANEASDPGTAICMARASASHRGISLPSNAPVPSGSAAARLCNAFVSAFVDGSPRSSIADTVALLADVFPELPSATIEVLNASIAGRDARAIRAAVAHASRRSIHPMLRAQLMMALIRALHDLRLDSVAIELERVAARDPAAELPGFRAVVGGVMFNHVGQLELRSSADARGLQRHVDSLASAANSVRSEGLKWGDQRARLKLLMEIGPSTSDRGMIEEAMPYLIDAVPLADSVGDLGWRAQVRMKLGRGLVKAGRAREAEALLLTARLLADSAQVPYVQREVEHNLLHLYESLHRDADARHAGEAFVRYTSIGRLTALRMMSARDVGRFLRARGHFDESRRYFSKMLADIDSLGAYTNYAGEYYELTGALDRALTEYQKAAARFEDALHAVAGLVRVTLAMGDTASARRWAQIHDESRHSGGFPEAAPLLPSVLRRTVGADTARNAFHVARREVLSHGQVAAWAGLTADLADLENEAGRFDVAAVLADSARLAATSVGAAEVALRARALAAFARARGTGAGARGMLATLGLVARESDRSGGVLLRAEVRRLFASALAAQGQWRSALDEFQRAVIPLDSVAGQIAMDPNQATFRSAQRRAYDEALQTIIANASVEGAFRAFASWSARRKGRSYAVQWPVDQGRAIVQPRRGTAIVDFVVLDTMLAALVVNADGARIVRFDISPQHLRADIKALRRAVDVRVGSTLDVGRAHYPLDVAHRLYRALIEPVESYLADARRLIIVPDGILALVPFDALVVRLPRDPADYRSAAYLLDRRIVSSATTLWTEPGAMKVSARQVLVIDPGTAPEAGREVDAVMTIMPPGAVTILRGTRATRREAIAAMKSASILHFAAHARANEHDPGSSQLELSPDGDDDGRLGATEVASLRLDSPLVVLSACETANGVVLDGEGVLSLSRSFLRAGARATVATLWPVGPAAADFAQSFYGSLAESDDAAGALHAAKLAMRSSGVSPLIWAPYQIFAAPAAAQTRSRTVAAGR